VSWKLSSTVLRGGANGNVGSPLGKKTGKSKQPYCLSFSRSLACGTDGEGQTERLWKPARS